MSDPLSAMAANHPWPEEILPASPEILLQMHQSISLHSFPAPFSTKLPQYSPNSIPPMFLFLKILVKDSLYAICKYG